MAAISPNELAASGDQGSFEPFQIYAGEKEIITDHYPAPANVAFAKWEVAALTAAGVLAKYDPAGSAPLNQARVVISQPIASSATPPTASPVHVSAFFNHAALVWPVATDTLAKRKAAFLGTNIMIGDLRG